MSYLLSNKISDTAFITSNVPSLPKFLQSFFKKARRILLSRLCEDREFENMANIMELRLAINQRSWKRNSALIVYSKYQNRK